MAKAMIARRRGAIALPAVRTLDTRRLMGALAVLAPEDRDVILGTMQHQAETIAALHQAVERMGQRQDYQDAAMRRVGDAVGALGTIAGAGSPALPVIGLDGSHDGFQDSGAELPRFRRGDMG